MVEGTECFGTFVTRKTLLIATIVTAVLLFPSFIVLCVGFATDCFEYHYSYGYYFDCRAREALIIAGGVSTGLCSLLLAGIIALWCKMRKAAPTTTFMTTQPYTTYGTPTVPTNTLQTAAQPAPYAVPNMGHPHYPQHPQSMPHAALPQAPLHQAPMSQTYVQQASMPEASMSQALLSQEPSAPMCQAPMPQAPMPQAPMPQAPMPQVPMPQVPMPQVPMPQEPLPLKQSS